MSAKRFPAILLFGAPGVGKGTQGRLLGEMPEYFHHSSGEVFRALDSNSPEGRKVAEYTSRGQLVPDDLTIRIWKQDLERAISTGRFDPERQILVLDGIPRNLAQAKILDDHIEIRRVVYLTSDDEERMIQRMKRRAQTENRVDDADEEVIRSRFEVYHQQSAPMLEYYPPDLVAEVDAIGAPGEVFGRIQRSLRQSCPL